MIKELAYYGSKNRQYPPWQAAHAWILLAHTKQQEDEDLTAYYKQFASVVERIESAYGWIKPNSVALKDLKYEAKKKDSMVSNCLNQMLDVMFMEGANRGFKLLLHVLESDYALCAALYPATVKDALQLLAECTNQLLYKSIVKSKKPIKQARRIMLLVSTKWARTKCNISLCFECKQNLAGTQVWWRATAIHLHNQYTNPWTLGVMGDLVCLRLKALVMSMQKSVLEDVACSYAVLIIWNRRVY